jgi:hypothetical protein
VPSSVLGYDLVCQPLLAASNVTLEVLASPSYFQGFELSSLDTSLNDGLADLGEQNSLSLGFEFYQFNEEPGPDLSLANMRSSIGNRCSVWRPK